MYKRQAPVSETKTVDWECFVDPALNYTTTVKYMSTQVYPNIGSELDVYKRQDKTRGFFVLGLC